MMVRMWIESQVPTEIDQPWFDRLALHAVSVVDEEPVVTGAEFRRFIGWQAINDRNGTWTTDGVREGDGALIYEDESGEYRWTVSGMSDGQAVYRLTGFAQWWTEV